MKTHERPACDDQRLQAVLAAAEDSDDLRAAAEHVERCPRCQARLSDLAAEADEWSEASRLLAEAEDDAALVEEQRSRPWNAALAGPATAWNEAMARQLLSAPSHPEMLGRLGRYEVERLIGSGGMGVVFKGFDTELNRPVAIKVLAPHLAGSGAARKRFAREARAAAAVVHEHVVAIHNVESDGAAPFLVMQFVAGESLQARLDRQGPLELCEILRIGRQTASGLAAAHAQGLVHRDVKPSNILLEHGVERALLTDFGLARACDDASLTHTGHMPGTPHYMSPEQARGESIDARSDLFSLGSVLYAMATGRPPFRAEGSFGILRRITDDAPRPIREVNADIPAWFDVLVRRLLAKSPAERFASAEEVASLLEQCLAHVRQPAAVPLPDELRSAPAGRRKIAAATALAGVLVLGVALGVFLVTRPGPVDPANPVGPAGPAGLDPAGDSGSASQVLPGPQDLQDLSPHETDWDAAAHEIETLAGDVEALSAEVDRLWPAPAGASPKGQPTAEVPRPVELAVADERVGVAEHDWKPLVLVGHDDWVTGVAFSPDGKRIASSSRDSTIRIWDAASGREVHTLKNDPPTRKGHFGSVYDVAFSPDGKYIASAGNDQSVRVWYANLGRTSLTHPRKFAFQSVAFSPDSKLLAAADYTSVRVWDNNRDSSTGAHREVLVLEAEQPLCVAFSPDGKWLASAGRDRKLRVWHAVTGEERFTAEHTAALFCVAFSPDGKRLVTASSDGVNVWDATTGDMLLGIEKRTGRLALSPDGRFLAVAIATSRVELWDPNTGEVLHTLPQHGNSVTSVAFSPDGTRLVSGSRDRTVRVWTLPPHHAGLDGS